MYLVNHVNNGGEFTGHTLQIHMTEFHSLAKNDDSDNDDADILLVTRTRELLFYYSLTNV